MGYYIQTPGTGRGKAAAIAAQYGADVLPAAPAWTEDEAIVCVVDNGIFEAAALCYSPDELLALSRPDDPRPKKWLLMDKATAHRLAGYAPRAA